MAILSTASNAPRQSKPSRRRLRWLGLAMGILCSAATAQQASEYEVKAAFLLNFTKFTEWPSQAFPGADAPFSICIMGADPFGNTLDQMIRGEEVNGRKITVQRIKRTPPPQACQVLFISKAEKDARRLVSDLAPGVLTVGEEESFLQGGGMIAFVVENRRTRFDINQAAAENAGLRLSSKLLNVARTVKQ